MNTTEPGSSRANNHYVAALLRPIGAMAVLLVGYFLLPIGRDSNWKVVGMTLGVGLLVGFCVWEVRHFLRSTRPVATAIEMLAAVMCFYIVAFSATYFLFSEYVAGAFNEHLSRVDALYFCLTVFTTTGFGDIAAVSEPARVAVSIQMASTLILLGLGIRFLNVLVQERVSGGGRLHDLRRRRAEDPDGR
ncbi:potassium channel family protein [Gordonia neofelifaecis]|uniref:Ion transport 2 domain-containing protein n=1 Tax=Gordonia neofelifaecis NRRL B-59395 TaxID=644548 RepID=F1YNA3_9ACTN|nr:potassium channel family protein [Gordonia neofelifaecis]EGD53814.1 ion transport 2 domain-containing protein [Gordonia neofelifaecis NRRL B-59395]